MTSRLPFGRLSALMLVAFAPAYAEAQDPFRWRVDYNSARQEAREQAKPLFIEFTTETCYYCRKLEATTLRDPVIVELLSNHFIPLKIDGNATPSLVDALKIQAYPTMVIAGSDGKIHGLIEGMMEVDRLKGHLQRALSTATPDWMARDFKEAGQSRDDGDYARSVSLLRGVIKDGKDRPVQVQAKRMLFDIEQQAAALVARAKELGDKGQSLEAADSLTQVLKGYAGTNAAGDAARMLASVGGRPELQQKQRESRAQELLAQAREEYRGGEYLRCLDHCELLARAYGDLQEGQSGREMADQIKSDPQIMQRVVQRMDEQMARMYVTLAEAWVQKGRPAEAKEVLERVVRSSPDSLAGELAQTRLKELETGSAMRPTENPGR